METKELIEIAKEEFLETFSSRIKKESPILLEEIEFGNDGSCKITLSFFEEAMTGGDNYSYFNVLRKAGLQSNLVKVYKVVYLNKNGKVEKISDHD
jgi:hypothetical protein